MSIPSSDKEIAQIVPPKQLEKLHQLMNFLNCFSNKLGFQEFLTAEEFFVVLEDSYKDPKLANLADYLASLLVDAFIKDLELKKIAKSLLQYEYDKNILRLFRDCLRRPSRRNQDLKRSWREILLFLTQTPLFRKLFMFRNPITDQNQDEDVESNEGGEEEEDKNSNGMEENQEDKSQEEEKEIEENNKDNNMNTDVEEKDDQIESFSLNNCNYQGYETYICRSIQRTDIPFKDFSVDEKLDAFAILIKIAYRLSFSTNFLVQKIKEGTKKNDFKDLRDNHDAKVAERETQAQELKKLTDLIESLNERLGNLNDEEERQHRISRQRVGIYKTALEKTDKAIQNIKSQILLKKREQFYQTSNWVNIGMDKSIGQYLVCEYEPNLIFKRVIKENKESYIEEDSNTNDDGQSCYLYQLGSLEDLKQHLDLSDKGDQQIQEKVVSLKNDKIIDIPEGDAKESSGSDIAPEVEGKKQSDELVNRRRKEIERNLGSRHFGPRTQEVQKQSATTQKSVNSLNTRFSRRLVPETLKQNQQNEDESEEDSDIEIEKLDSFMFKPKQTRSSTNSGKQKRKVIIDDDDDDGDDDEDF